MHAASKEIDIHVTTRPELEQRLDEAVRRLQDAAMLTRKHGILLIRHRPGHYTAALSEEVPFGITREFIN